MDQMPGMSDTRTGRIIILGAIEGCSRRLGRRVAGTMQRMREHETEHRVGVRPGWIFLGLVAAMVGGSLGRLDWPTEEQISLAEDEFFRPAERPFAGRVWPASAEMSTVEFAAGRGEAYRFVWMRTFARPVVVRVEVEIDRRARLILKVFDGPGGYPWGPLVVNRSVFLGPVEIRRLRLGFFVNRFRGLHGHLFFGSVWLVSVHDRGFGRLY